MKFLRMMIVLFIVFISTLIFGQTVYDRTGIVKIGWNHPIFFACDNETTMPASDCLLYWEIILVRDVTGEEFRFTTYPMATMIEILRPKSGIYRVKVQAVASSCCNGTTPCPLGWTESTDGINSTLEDGVTPGTWKVRFKPSAPAGPIIIY